MEQRFCCRLLSALFLIYAAITVRAQTVIGHVMLGEVTPAPYATIYIPALGQGTVSDYDGNYVLDVPRGRIEVEFSYLGYSTVKRELTIEEATTYVLDENLEEQPVSLGEVYVTPTGEDPALFILRKVAEHAELNRKSLKHYEAQRQHVFHAQDVDFLPAILPKPVNWILKTAMKVKHRGAIYDFCNSHESVDARMATEVIYDRGNLTYTNEKLLSSNPAMTDKAKEQIFQMTHKDLFDAMYGNDKDYSMKMLKKGKCNYKLKGSVEENGLVIDVLVNDNSGDKDDPGVMTLYVVEDLWCILRSEFNGKMTYERFECRDVGDGIYMPVCHLIEPTFAAIDLEQDIEKYRSEQAEKERKGDKISAIERQFLDRLERYAQKQSNPKPSITTSFSISYRNVKLAK